ncbi:hypothetical protein KW784_00680 [Candidatus Parcubacteria bacterium]|nr:hypothetical protein [Candidatus Parcubacteria bacterium]
MQALAQNKGSLFLAAILLAGIFAYNAFFSVPALAPGAPSASSVGADLIKVSDNISKATLSRDLFSATAYRLLSDFSVPLVPEPSGRLNPFAPIGQE